jgi:signal transduction histidine kinase
MYGAATELGITTSDLQSTTGLVPSRIARSIHALALVQPGAPPTIFALATSDARAVLDETAGELTPLADNRYLLALPHGSGESRAVFSMEALIDVTAEHSRPLVGLVLRDDESIVYTGEVGRDDFLVDRRLELGGRVFHASISAGPTYTAPGARVAGITTMFFAVALAALAWQVQTSVEARIAAEADRAEMAEHLNAGKDRFLASVAHELRTPLSVIMGTTMELLANGDVHSHAEQREMLEMAAGESISIRDTIEDMLVTARLASGNLAVNRRRADIVELAENHVSTIDARHGVTIQFEPSTIGEATVDPGRWIHAFRNLMSNAVDHAHSYVRVSFAQDKATTLVMISDDGPGLPDGLVEHAFRPYSALDEASTSPSPVGVGLSVARGLARKLGGDVSYRRTGTTSVFTLSVPTNPDDGHRHPGLAPVPSIAS